MPMSDGKSKRNEPEGGQLSRREWLLKLGEAAVLLGFSGTTGEAGLSPASDLVLASEPASAGGLDAPAAAGLPPGLYEPSSDHLSHALSNDSLFHPIPPGSETDYVRPRTGPFEPQFFSPPEFQTVKRIVELMLGEAHERSSTAAAGNGGSDEEISAVVAEWIDLRVASAVAVRQAARRLKPDHRALAIAYHGSAAPVENLENFDPQSISAAGLEWLAEQSERRHGKALLDLTEEQQIGILKEISDDRPGTTTENAGARFFNLIKAEAIRGFYTSQAGLMEIDYKGNAFYAESPGCQGHDH